MTLRFRADIGLGSEEKLVDEYPKILAGRLLSEEITEKLGKIWNVFAVESVFVIFEEHDSAEFVPKVRDGTFDWRYYLERSIVGSSSDFGFSADCAVLVNDSAALSHEDEWNALHGLLQEYNAELNDLDRYPALSLSIYFAPGELYGECAARMKEPLSFVGDSDEYLEFLDEKLGEPVYIGAGAGLTPERISECGERYLKYRNDQKTEENT